MERADFDVEINAILSEAEQLIPDTVLPDLPMLPEMGACEWHPFELALWQNGEEIRQLILAEKNKTNSGQIERICRICTDPRAKRGRQSFVLLLGRACYVPYAPVVAELLTDENVAGQAVDTLYKMRTPDYTARIEPLTRHKHTWIRNIAKKYMHKYG